MFLSRARLSAGQSLTMAMTESTGFALLDLPVPGTAPVSAPWFDRRKACTPRCPTSAMLLGAMRVTLGSCLPSRPLLGLSATLCSAILSATSRVRMYSAVSAFRRSASIPARASRSYTVSPGADSRVGRPGGPAARSSPTTRFTSSGVLTSCPWLAGVGSGGVGVGCSRGVGAVTAGRRCGCGTVSGLFIGCIAPSGITEAPPVAPN